ncbi:hypothetical protein [Sphingomonas sp. M1-B02]|uniref:hypothetical protein n=1 Tax=Sphingomonas sp. M1-B02 TaxID=3114300 RepID=UPI0022407F82|nr:hypothetical protein [Sphingomonas sp. S6-11]UZK65967.1 hypothetical protein OKW87_15885 [Sphingomonas sp. S6-11]
MPHLPTHPAHLSLNATATVEPEMTGPEWYAAYGERHAADGIEGRLGSQESRGRYTHSPAFDAPLAK